MTDKRRGLIQVYHGTGKGKTTAALGLALRASGQGMRICIIQFMKEMERLSGEVEAIKNIDNIDIYRFGESFISNPPSEAPKIKERVFEGITFAKEAVSKGEYDIVILDEINVALHLQVAKVGDILRLIDLKSSDVELILTGRYPPKEILEKADLITDMDQKLHPYDKGIVARKGIEF